MIRVIRRVRRMVRRNRVRRILGPGLLARRAGGPGRRRRRRLMRRALRFA